MRISPFLSSRPPMTISEPPFRFDEGNTGGCAGEGVSRLAAARGRRRLVDEARLRFFATKHDLAIAVSQELWPGDDPPVAHQHAAARHHVHRLERAGAQ